MDEVLALAAEVLDGDGTDAPLLLLDGNPDRPYAELLKNILDDFNNGLHIVDA